MKFVHPVSDHLDDIVVGGVLFEQLTNEIDGMACPGCQHLSWLYVCCAQGAQYFVNMLTHRVIEVLLAVDSAGKDMHHALIDQDSELSKR